MNLACIYVFNLRGNQRTSGETSRQEGGKIFGSGSRAGIAISVFIKNPKKPDHVNCSITILVIIGVVKTS
jgi:predicted helicase